MFRQFLFEPVHFRAQIYTSELPMPLQFIWSPVHCIAATAFLLEPVAPLVQILLPSNECDIPL